MVRLRKHLTYANVTTTLLLFIVLGGGSAYALDGINTVFTDDIVNGQVKTPDLADSAVTGRKVMGNSLTPGDIDGIVGQPHGATEVATSDPFVKVPYPLSATDWSQPAGELQIVTGTVTYKTPPADCILQGTPGTYGNGRVDIGITGALGAEAYLSPLPLDTVKTTTIVSNSSVAGAGPRFLYPSGAGAYRTATATISDNCQSGNFTVQSIRMNIVGAS